MSVVCRYVSEKEEAHSILNEGFLKVFQNLKNFNQGQDFKPWFKTILINSSLNYIKKMKRFTVETEIDQAKHLSVSELILSKLHYNEILEMVQSLSTAYRTVFNLHVVDGYSHEEIATQLGITVSTSKSNLARAKERLRETLIKKQVI
jgi:RNA polymerase sigma factor (sigma-70 family)